MGQTLTHGVYLPAEGERNCYDGLASNWNILDGAVGTIAEHTTALAGKAPAVHTHTKSDVTDLLNSNFIPSANNSYDLGSSSYQWNNLYAKNYYYNGTPWGLDKANVWTSDNTFKNTEYQIGETPSATRATYINFTDKNNARIGWIQRRIETSGTSSIELMVQNKFTNSQPDTAGTTDYVMLKLGLTSSQTHFCEIGGHTYPRYNNAYDLGSSSYQWNNVYSKRVNTQTLNGTNPGALSLPSSNYVEIDTTGWDLTGSTYNRVYINNANPTFPGILFIRINSSDPVSILVRFFSTSGSEIAYSGSKIEAGSNSMIATVPCPPDTNIYVQIETTSTITACRYYTLLGDPEFNSRSSS